jgi:hypothetical protein
VIGALAGIVRAEDAAIVYRVEHYVELEGTPERGVTLCDHAPTCRLDIREPKLKVSIEWRDPSGPQVVVDGTDPHFLDSGRPLDRVTFEPSRRPACRTLYHGGGWYESAPVRDLVLRRAPNAGIVCLRFEPYRKP